MAYERYSQLCGASGNLAYELRAIRRFKSFNRWVSAQVKKKWAMVLQRTGRSTDHLILVHYILRPSGLLRSVGIVIPAQNTTSETRDSSHKYKTNSYDGHGPLPHGRESRFTFAPAAPLRARPRWAAATRGAR